MKTLFRFYLLALFLLSVGVRSEAQSIFFDNEDRFSQILDILSIAQGEYIIASEIDRDKGVKIEWFKDDTIHSVHTIWNDIVGLDLEMTNEGVLVETSTYLECDVSIPKFAWFILDTIDAGPIATFDMESMIEKFADVRRLANGDIVMIEGYAAWDKKSTGLKIYSGDNEVYTDDLPNDELVNIKEIEDRVYIFGKEYVLHSDIDTYVFDTIYLEGSTILDVEGTNVENEIYILSDFGVYRLNSDTGEELENVPLFAGDGGPKDIIFTDRLYLLRSYEEMENSIELIDEEGNWESISNNLFYAASLREFHLMSNGELWLSGIYCPNFGYTSQCQGAYIVQKFGSLVDDDNDLAIEFIDYATANGNDLEVSLRLTNLSDHDLKDIDIYSSNLEEVWCSSKYLHHNVESIQAGESINIKDTVHLWFGRVDGDICFWTYGNERNVDLDREDNVSCAQITSVKDNVLTNENYKVYPNPATEILYIKGALAEETFQIFNVNGVKLLDVKYEGGISISRLPAGVYIFVNDGTEGVGRFVKN